MPLPEASPHQPPREALHAIRSHLAAGQGRVHMVGIGGIGMAGVAFHLHKRGFQVSGCERMPSRVTRWLEAAGIRVMAGHDRRHAEDGVDWMVRTAAVPEAHEEVMAARRLGVPVFPRGLVLPALLDGRYSIAVSGTHGKTTTTAMIARVLQAGGRSPSFCVGGEWGPGGAMAGVGEGRDLVVEADESDGTAAYYSPEVAVVTNIEFDHMENFQSEAALEACFLSFVRQAKTAVVYCADDPRAARLCARGNGHAYGFSEEAATRGIRLEDGPGGIGFEAVHDGAPLGRIKLNVPGRHNAQNALAALAVALRSGVAFDQARDGLESFSAVRRRFDLVADRRGIKVISDYAHHPTEIRALVQTALLLKPRRLLAVFQPHRYTRTLALGGDFPPAFEGVGEVVLLPVYAASESPLAGGASEDLLRRFREQGKVPARLEADLEGAWENLKPDLREGDVLLVVGAGDVEQIAAWAERDLR